MEPKTSHLNIRVTETEHRAIAARAHKSGLTLSAYVRRGALKGGAAVPAVDADGLRHAYADLKHSGSNINQVAKVLNTYGADAIPASAIDAAARKVADAADAVASALSTLRG